MRFRGSRGRRFGRRGGGGGGGQGDPRGALAIPFIWMLLICVLSFATIIVTATNSNNQNTKVVTGFEAVFYILMYITMCNILKFDRAKYPKTFKTYFCIYLIFAVCLVIFCAINISLVQNQQPAILTMTLVQTCLVLGFTICSVFCCCICNFGEGFQKQQQAAAAASNIQVQLNVQRRSQQLAQNRNANMVNMYQQQLSNQLAQAQQASGLGGMSQQQIAQQQQQIAFLQQQHQMMMQQIQQQQMQLAQAQGIQPQGLQPGPQQQQPQQQNPFPALYQPQFLGVNPQQMPQQMPQQQQQGQLPLNYQPFPVMQPGAAMMAPNLAQGGQQPQQGILPNQHDAVVVEKILSNLGVNMRHDSTNVKFSDSKQLNSFMIERQMTKKTLKEQTANDENTCPICLVDFENADEIITLKQCGHYFHKECIKDWLMKANLTCPLCRSDLEIPQEWKKTG